MNETVKAVLDKDWRLCPECHSEVVGAVKNGFQIDKFSTDLMLCYDCKRLYVVFPDTFLKRQPKKRAEYSKDITFEIPEALITEKARLIEQHEITQKAFDAIREKEENRL